MEERTELFPLLPVALATPVPPAPTVTVKEPERLNELAAL
jgi:hypothetical protein